MSGPRWNAIQWVASVAALIGSIAAVTKGFAPERFRPVLAFAVLWAATANGAILGRAGLRRRADRLKNGSIPQGVRLVAPLWIPLVDVFEVLAVAGALGAAAAAVEFAGVGVGIVIAIGLMVLGMTVTEWFFRTDLTFEPGGLRVDKRRIRFFIEWSSIVDVGIRPAANPLINVQIADPIRLLATIEPDTPQNRRRLQVMLAVGSVSGRTMVFFNWTAGLDSATLARALRETMGDPRHRMN